MLLKVNEVLKETLLNYVKQEPAINLFIIGDIEQYGLNQEFQEVYLQYNANHQITSCLLRYYTSVVFYSHTKAFQVDEIINILKTLKFDRLSGKKECLDLLVPHLEQILKIEDCFFCECPHGNQLVKPEVHIKQAGLSDLPKLYECLKHTDFHITNYIESNTRKLEQKSGRIYYVENNDNEVISTAGTSIETSVSAMIGGVTTLHTHRNQGLASQIVSQLASDLLSEGKTPCLFYFNQAAGSIYHRIGFQDIGLWTLVWMKEVEE
jgi:uncharacterized protein